MKKGFVGKMRSRQHGLKKEFESGQDRFHNMVDLVIKLLKEKIDVRKNFSRSRSY